MGGIFTQKKVIPYSVRGTVNWTALPTPFPVGYEIPVESTITGYRSGPKWDSKVPTGTGEEVLTQAIAGNHFLTPFDNGHEVDIVTRYKPTTSHQGKTIRSSFGDVTYVQTDLMPSGSGYDPIPETDLVYYGTEFISQTRPRSAVELSSIFAQLLSDQELPDLKLKLIFDKVSFFRSLGPAFLNFEFGWKPFISDLHSLLQQVLLSYQTIQQYSKDGQPGKTVRRSRTINLPTEITESIDIHAPSVGGSNMFTGFFGSRVVQAYGNTVHKTTAVDKSIRFSAEYAYTVDVGKDVFSRMHAYAQKATALLDIRVTPEVLWELTPWTWLADWFADVGSILGNASAVAYDGLVIKYAYVTCNTSVATIFSVDDFDFFEYHPGTISSYFSQRRYQRIKATPFGFGLNPDTFSPEQWSILAAIGMADNAQNLHGR